MQGFVDLVQGFLALGATVILPVVIFLLGLLFGQKPGKAFRSGLTIGVAFVGIFLVVDLLVNNLGPAAQGMVDRLGVNLDVIDVGWPATSSIAWASTAVAAFIIPLGLLVNVVMLLTKTTKTMNVDIWNFWHYTFMAAVVYTVSDSIIQGLIAAVIFQIVTLKIADWTAPMVEDFYELPGVSIATGSTVSYAPGIFLVKGLQKIPGINRLSADPDSIQRRFGVFGESIFIGLFLGVAIGALAGYSVGEVIEIGMAMAAVMVLMPRMVKILMEGLMPVSESARNWLNKHFSNKEIYIGLDAAVLLGMSLIHGKHKYYFDRYRFRVVSHDDKVDGILQYSYTDRFFLYMFYICMRNCNCNVASRQAGSIFIFPLDHCFNEALFYQSIVH